MHEQQPLPRRKVARYGKFEIINKQKTLSSRCTSSKKCGFTVFQLSKMLRQKAGLCLHTILPDERPGRRLMGGHQENFSRDMVELLFSDIKLQAYQQPRNCLKLREKNAQRAKKKLSLPILRLRQIHNFLIRV